MYLLNHIQINLKTWIKYIISRNLDKIQTILEKVVPRLATEEFENLKRSIIGEGNGTPLQYSCLENPMDGGAW